MQASAQGCMEARLETEGSVSGAGKCVSSGTTASMAPPATTWSTLPSAQQGSILSAACLYPVVTLQQPLQVICLTAGGPGPPQLPDQVSSPKILPAFSLRPPGAACSRSMALHTPLPLVSEWHRVARRTLKAAPA